MRRLIPILMLAATPLACSAPPEKAADPVAQVRTAPVVSADLDETITAYGQVEFDAAGLRALTAPFEAQVVQIHVRVGQSVTAGQPLVTLGASPQTRLDLDRLARDAQLELSLAGRVEDHERVGSTSNPKIGLLYGPIPNLVLRASWGTSFRAPSLRELQSTYQIGPSFLSRGGGNILTLIQYGGNPDLRPETAESITAGFVWTPAAYEGLRLEGNWFRTRFNDRIGNPVIQNLANALNDPALAPFVRYVSPTTSAEDRALVQSLLDDPGNFNPTVFPATSYGVIVDNRFVNAASIEVEGLDLSARYRFELATGQVMIDGTITHLLTNDRQITTASPVERLLGDPNFPARWRARAGTQWVRGPITLGLIANYVSGGRDPLSNRQIDDWTTFDGQVRYDFATGWGEGLSLALNVLNLANAAPPFYDSPNGVGFDGANTNALGPQLSLQLVKRW